MVGSAKTLIPVVALEEKHDARDVVMLGTPTGSFSHVLQSLHAQVVAGCGSLEHHLNAGTHTFNLF